jgi:hypothetical protein
MLRSSIDGKIDLAAGFSPSASIPIRANPGAEFEPPAESELR